MADVRAAFERAAERARRAPVRVERRPERLLAPGVPTFVEAPRVSLDGDLSGLDAVVLGVPFEGVVVKDPRTFYPQGTAPPPGHDLYSRPGAFEAPAAIRRASLLYSLDHSNGFMPERGLAIGDHLRLGDGGDLPVAGAPADEALDAVSAAVERVVRAGAVPLVIGGDHLVSLFVLAGIHRAAGRPMGVVTYDSHLDLSREPPDWAGSQWVGAMELGALDPANLVQIGIRGLRNSRLWQAAAEELGVRYYPMSEVDRRGLAEVNGEAIAHAREGVDLLYLSIDVDAFEPAACPAQKYPEPGGFSAREIVRSVGEVVASGNGICGFDFCCLGPAYDLGHMGAAVAARCFVEVLGGLAARRR